MSIITFPFSHTREDLKSKEGKIFTKQSTLEAENKLKLACFSILIKSKISYENNIAIFYFTNKSKYGFYQKVFT